jgi:membrane protease YdiL (CAAX protease family)
MRVILGTLLVFGVAFLSVFALQLVAVTAVLSWRGGSLEDNGLAALLAGVPASSLALIGVAWLAARPPRRDGLRLGPGRMPGREVAVMAIGVLALSQALESLVLLLDMGPGPTLEWMTRTVASATPLGLALAVVVVGLLAPVAEELFFRGYMLTRLRAVWSPGPAILMSAVAFGIIHGEWTHGLLAAVIGVYLGLVTERAGSVTPAMICHAVNNTASVVLSAWFGSPTSHALNAGLVVAMGLVVAWALVRLRRGWPAAESPASAAGIEDRGQAP